MENISDEDNYLAQLLQLYRVQRHDFLNHFQVAMGYIQLGKADKALDYLRRAAETAMEQAPLSKISTPELAVELMEFNTACFNQGIACIAVAAGELPQIGWRFTYTKLMDILREEIKESKGVELKLDPGELEVLLTVKFIGMSTETLDDLTASVLALDIQAEKVQVDQECSLQISLKG